MERNFAEIIGTKAKALKHCEKLIRKIEKANGEPVKIPLSCTGVMLEAREGSPLYLQIKAISAKLAEEINALQISFNSINMEQTQKTAVAKKPAVVEQPQRKRVNYSNMSQEEIIAHKKEKRKEYNQRYRNKLKLQQLSLFS